MLEKEEKDGDYCDHVRTANKWHVSHSKYYVFGCYEKGHQSEKCPVFFLQARTAAFQRCKSDKDSLTSNMILVISV